MNDLTTLSQNLPAHLRATDQDMAEFQTGIQSGLDIAFLSIRGKEFRFRYQGNETSTRSRQLDVVVVASRPNISKRWFESAYEPGSIDMPACFSLDGVRPSDASTNKQAEKCSMCPRNQFGSKITSSGKQGKECDDYKRFAVLPVLDGKITDTPVIMDLPFGSLKKKREDRSDNMFWQEYGAALYRHQIAPYAVVTRLEFTDAEYPQVCFAFNRALTEDEAKAARAAREDETVKAALADEQVEPVGAITEQSDEPAPESTKAEAPDTSQSNVANLLRGDAPAEKPAPAPEPAKEPEAKEPEPAKQEAAPAPEAQEPEPEQSDLMDQIRASLKKMGG